MPLRLSWKNTESAVLYFSDQTYTNRKEETLLGIIINNKLSFYGQIKGLCKKTPQKLSALSKITPYLDSSQKITIFKSIIKSQFSYCPLDRSRASINTINKIHERALRITLDNNNESFVELLARSQDMKSNCYLYQQALERTVGLSTVLLTYSRNGKRN